MTVGPVHKLANLWIGRNRSDRAGVALARSQVSHLKSAVLITGGSRGIGAALARRFAEAGHDIFIVARNRSELSAQAELISRETGGFCSPIVQDICHPDAPETIAAQVEAQGYYVEYLVNNAGLGLAGKFESHDSASIERLIELNITAATRLMRSLLPGLLARRQGGVLNVSSLGGAVPGPHQASYYASRAYLISLTEAVAAENSGQGVRIAVLAPGAVNTGFHRSMGAEASLYRRLLPSLSPERTARTAYRAFMIGQRVIVPGLFNRLSYFAVRVLPHPVTVPLMAWLLTKR